MGNNNSSWKSKRRELLKMSAATASLSIPLTGSVAAGSDENAHHEYEGEECNKTVLVDNEEELLKRINCGSDNIFIYTDKKSESIDEVVASEGEVSEVVANDKSAVEAFETNSIITEYDEIMGTFESCSHPTFDDHYGVGASMIFEDDIRNYSAAAIGGAVCNIPNVGSFLARVAFGGACGALGEFLQRQAEGNEVLLGCYDKHLVVDPAITISVGTHLSYEEDRSAQAVADLVGNKIEIPGHIEPLI